MKRRQLSIAYYALPEEPVTEDASYEHQAPEASIQANPPYRNFAYKPPSV